ncbi:hypothetical protein [Pseudomonas fluorescens]|uniref:hypothetical protein n=1 Tax=Pseudomonas fluorescens TaxID=294 RepID=UPI0016560CD1|nr:hypothetical protein [Pseudomonas fluorescens]MBC8782842.1 hypothetical protein [Pseudomonas fluorescens]
MDDLERLSKEYLLLEERFERIKLDPSPPDSDFLNALMALAEAAHKLKKITAQIRDNHAPRNRTKTPHLRLVKSAHE